MAPENDRRNDDVAMGRLLEAVETNTKVVGNMAARQITQGELLAAQGVSINEVKEQTKEQWNTLGKISDSLWGHKVKTAGIAASVTAFVLWAQGKLSGGG